jgi:hypothetical protein
MQDDDFIIAQAESFGLIVSNNPKSYYCPTMNAETAHEIISSINLQKYRKTKIHDQTLQNVEIPPESPILYMHGLETLTSAMQRKKVDICFEMRIFRVKKRVLELLKVFPSDIF